MKENANKFIKLKKTQMLPVDITRSLVIVSPAKSL